jgi:hypothetical protein
MSKRPGAPVSYAASLAVEPPTAPPPPLAVGEASTVQGRGRRKGPRPAAGGN